MSERGRKSQEDLRATGRRIAPNQAPSHGWGAPSGGVGQQPSGDAGRDYTVRDYSATVPTSAAASAWGASAAPAAPARRGRFGRGAGSARAAGGARESSYSRSTWVAIAVIVLAAIALGVTVHAFWSGIDVLGWVLRGTDLYSTGLVAVMALLGLVALAGIVLAMVSMIRSEKRALGAILILAGIALPVAAGFIGLSTGVDALAESTEASAVELTEQLTPAEIDSVEDVYDSFEAVGIELPGREEVLEILEQNQSTEGDGA